MECDEDGSELSVRRLREACTSQLPLSERLALAAELTRLCWGAQAAPEHRRALAGPEYAAPLCDLLCEWAGQARDLASRPSGGDDVPASLQGVLSAISDTAGLDHTQLGTSARDVAELAFPALLRVLAAPTGAVLPRVLRDATGTLLDFLLGSPGNARLLAGSFAPELCNALEVVVRHSGDVASQVDAFEVLYRCERAGRRVAGAAGAVGREAAEAIARLAQRAPKTVCLASELRALAMETNRTAGEEAPAFSVRLVSTRLSAHKLRASHGAGWVDFSEAGVTVTPEADEEAEEDGPDVLDIGYSVISSARVSALPDGLVKAALVVEDAVARLGLSAAVAGAGRSAAEVQLTVKAEALVAAAAGAPRCRAALLRSALSGMLDPSPVSAPPKPASGRKVSWGMLSYRTVPLELGPSPLGRMVAPGRHEAETEGTGEAGGEGGEGGAGDGEAAGAGPDDADILSRTRSVQQQLEAVAEGGDEGDSAGSLEERSHDGPRGGAGRGRPSGARPADDAGRALRVCSGGGGRGAELDPAPGGTIPPTPPEDVHGCSSGEGEDVEVRMPTESARSEVAGGVGPADDNRKVQPADGSDGGAQVAASGRAKPKSAKRLFAGDVDEGGRVAFEIGESAPEEPPSQRSASIELGIKQPLPAKGGKPPTRKGEKVRDRGDAAGGSKAVAGRGAEAAVASPLRRGRARRAKVAPAIIESGSEEESDGSTTSEESSGSDPEYEPSQATEGGSGAAESPAWLQACQSVGRAQVAFTRKGKAAAALSDAPTMAQMATAPQLPELTPEAAARQPEATVIPPSAAAAAPPAPPRGRATTTLPPEVVRAARAARAKAAEPASPARGEKRAVTAPRPVKAKQARMTGRAPQKGGNRARKRATEPPEGAAREPALPRVPPAVQGGQPAGDAAGRLQEVTGPPGGARPPLEQPMPEARAGPSPPAASAPRWSQTAPAPSRTKALPRAAAAAAALPIARTPAPPARSPVAPPAVATAPAPPPLPPAGTAVAATNPWAAALDAAATLAGPAPTPALKHQLCAQLPSSTVPAPRTSSAPRAVAPRAAWQETPPRFDLGLGSDLGLGHVVGGGSAEGDRKAREARRGPAGGFGAEPRRLGVRKGVRRSFSGGQRAERRRSLSNGSSEGSGEAAARGTRLRLSEDEEEGGANRGLTDDSDEDDGRGLARVTAALKAASRERRRKAARICAGLLEKTKEELQARLGSLARQQRREIEEAGERLRAEGERAEAAVAEAWRCAREAGEELRRVLVERWQEVGARQEEARARAAEGAAALSELAGRQEAALEAASADARARLRDTAAEVARMRASSATLPGVARALRMFT